MSTNKYLFLKIVGDASRRGGRLNAHHSWLHRCALLACVLTVATASPALADGDPPSDVLVAQDVYYGWGLNTEDKGAAQLPVMLANAREHGFELKVALISNYSDLGLVGNFWQKPDEYVRYLGDELSLVYHGRLLVVMRNGYGIYQNGAVPGKARRTLSRLDRPGSVTRFFASAVKAVRQLAASEGVDVPVPDVVPPDGGMTNAPPPQHGAAPVPASDPSTPTRSRVPPAASSGASNAWLFLVPVTLFIVAALVAIGRSRRAAGRSHEPSEAA